MGIMFKEALSFRSLPLIKNSYNSMRPHQKLGFRTPEKLEDEYFLAV
jgi:hypothetical protein